MKGFLVLVLSIFAAVGVGMVVCTVVQLLGGDGEVVSLIGSGVGVLGFLTVVTYLSLWVSDPSEFAEPPTPTTTGGIWRVNKDESKLQSAAWRLGFVYALIGGVISGAASESNVTLVVVVIFCGAVGWWIGFDFKRRVLKIREREPQRKF